MSLDILQQVQKHRKTSINQRRRAFYFNKYGSQYSQEILSEVHYATLDSKSNKKDCKEWKSACESFSNWLWNKYQILI